MLCSGTIFYSHLYLQLPISSISFSLPLSPCPLAFACAVCLAESVMKETSPSAPWKDSGNKMFIAVLLPSFQITKSFKEEDTQVHSFSCVLFSLIECLEHAVFYCERSVKYCVSSLSLKEYYFCKDRFEKCTGCILIEGV